MQDGKLLEGIKVLDVATFIFGPAAATVMSDFGADVIKIEHPKIGDPYRYLTAMAPMPTCGHNYCWLLTGRNKRSVGLDLTKPEARKVLHQLAAGADVLITNYHPSVLTKLGMRWEDLQPLNDRLVYAQASGYGETGDEVEKPGYDASAWWGRSGLMDAVRALGAEPGSSMPGMGDHPSAMALLSAIMMALYRRERTGKGGKVSSSLLANGVWSNSCLIQGELCGSVPYPPMKREDSPNALVNLYRTADGRFLFLLLLMDERDWPRLAPAIGRPELLSDPRFATKPLRTQNASLLYGEIAKTLASRPFAEWRDVLDRNDLTFGAMALTSEAKDDPQMIANGLFPELRGDGVDGLRTVSSPIWLEGEEKVEPRRAPEIGQHTVDVLRELGYTTQAIDAMRGVGAIGQ
jgi:crotonobetainyl-CoA:carnitine CoA-transferase CaiB-like acyl-CoA transferase